MFSTSDHQLTAEGEEEHPRKLDCSGTDDHVRFSLLGYGHSYPKSTATSRNISSRVRSPLEFKLVTSQSLVPENECGNPSQIFRPSEPHSTTKIVAFNEAANSAATISLIQPRR